MSRWDCQEATNLILRDRVVFRHHRLIRSNFHVIKLFEVSSWGILRQSLIFLARFLFEVVQRINNYIWIVAFGHILWDSWLFFGLFLRHLFRFTYLFLWFYRALLGIDFLILLYLEITLETGILFNLSSRLLRFIFGRIRWNWLWNVRNIINFRL